MSWYISWFPSKDQASEDEPSSLVWSLIGWSLQYPRRLYFPWIGVAGLSKDMPALTFPGPWCFSTEPGAQARPAAHSLVTSSWGGGDRGNQKMMNIGKFRIRKSWTIYALCQASLLRNTASYILFAGRERDRESWLSNVVTENTGYLRPSCTRADITKTQGLEASSQKPQIDSFEGLAPAPDRTLSSLPLGKGTELSSLCLFCLKALWESLGWPASPHCDLFINLLSPICTLVSHFLVDLKKLVL